MKKRIPIKRSDFDLKCALILANRKMSLDEKAYAILKLKRSASTPTRKSRF